MGQSVTTTSDPGLFGPSLSGRSDHLALSMPWEPGASPRSANSLSSVTACGKARALASACGRRDLRPPPDVFDVEAGKVHVPQQMKLFGGNRQMFGLPIRPQDRPDAATRCRDEASRPAPSAAASPRPADRRSYWRPCSANSRGTVASVLFRGCVSPSVVVTVPGRSTVTADKV